MAIRLYAKDIADIMSATASLSTIDDVKRELWLASQSNRLWLLWRRMHIEAVNRQTSIEKMLSVPEKEEELSVDQLSHIDRIRKTIPVHTKHFEDKYPDGDGGIAVDIMTQATRKSNEEYKEVLRYAAHCGCMFTGSWRFRPAGVFLSIRDFVTDSRMPEIAKLENLPHEQRNLILVYLDDLVVWYAKEKRKARKTHEESV